jgi:hypothetical protein
MPVLSRRALNRALLARQWLLRRRKAPALDLVDHLVGLQAQAPNIAYVALWSRLAKFKQDELSQLIVDRKVVRLALMRSTIHLVTAQDAQALRPLVQPMLIRAMKGPFGKHLHGLDLEAVTESGRAAVEEKPLTFADLGARLQEKWPDRDAQALAQVVRAYVPLVQVPPRGLWGIGGSIAHTSAEKWLGKEGKSATLEKVLLRYLAAFGPASVMDVQKWSGLTRLAPVLKTLRPKLLVFENEDGRELFDVEDAPRPKEETVAPVRFLPEWDNALLSHADRSRILAEDVRKKFFISANGILPGTVLIDGFVAAAWNVVRQGKAATLVVRPTRKLSRAESAEVEEEGSHFLAFIAEQAERRDVEVRSP